jgi:potassium voltage-gated channel Shal-related subfamily D member 2
MGENVSRSRELNNPLFISLKPIFISFQEIEDTGHPEDPLYSPVYSARQPLTLQTPPPPRTPLRDLTNMKLAQNQTELSKQIEDLTATVEIQGRMLQRLLEIMAENPGKVSSTDR